MGRIDDLVERLCPEGVEYKTLGEVGIFTRGSGIQKKDFVEEGIGCIHYGQIYTSYGLFADKTISFISTDFAKGKRMAKQGDLIIATTSENEEDVCKAVVWLGNEEIAVSNDAYIFRHSLNPKYMGYFFQSNLFQTQKMPCITGTKVLRVSGSSMAGFRIPVPPMEIQEEIVRMLDTFSELETELETMLETELEHRQSQYFYYRNRLLSNKNLEYYMRGKVEHLHIEDICTSICSGGTPSTKNAEYYDGGTIPWVRTQDVDYCRIEDSSAHITEIGLSHSAAKWIPANCVIVAMYGATAAKVAMNSIPVTTNQACCNLAIDNTKALPRYVYHWLACRYEDLKSLGEGSQANISGKKVRSYPIDIPTLNAQKQVVDILDKFDALMNDLSSSISAEMEARRKQYEYYRDKLLTFKEKPSG